jgi:hypothetical protein
MKKTEEGTVVVAAIPHNEDVDADVDCWGSVQITKIYWLHNPELPKDLSTSNVVTVNRSSEMYPRRPNAGIMLPHKR